MPPVTRGRRCRALQAILRHQFRESGRTVDTSSGDVPEVAAVDADPRRSLLFWIGVGFGLGLLRPAPGTWGSLLGLPLGWALSLLPLGGGLIVWVGLLGIGWMACETAAKALGAKDPGEIVVDEYLALAAIYLFVPPTALALILGFGLFRLFDIWKPWPVSALDRAGGTAGVMLDDVAAAGYAGGVLASLIAVAG